MSEDKTKRVLITGAMGLVGRVVTQDLARDHSVTLVDRRVAYLGRGGVRRLDTRNLRRLVRLVRGHDVIVDLAADPRPSAPWSTVLRNNMPAAVAVLEAARAAGVPRVVMASSNRVVLGYESTSPYDRVVAGDLDNIVPADVPPISATAPARPDSPYAVGKVAAEAAGRLYSEVHGMSVLCLRLGTVRPDDRPSNARQFATWLSHRDLTQLVRCGVHARDDLTWGVFFGVSRNRWRFWDLDAAEADLGYQPVDDGERFRP